MLPFSLSLTHSLLLLLEFSRIQLHAKLQRPLLCAAEQSRKNECEKIFRRRRNARTFPPTLPSSLSSALLIVNTMKCRILFSASILFRALRRARREILGFHLGTIFFSRSISPLPLPARCAFTLVAIHPQPPLTARPSETATASVMLRTSIIPAKSNFENEKSTGT